MVPEGWFGSTFDELILAGDILKIQDGNHGNDHPKASDYVQFGVPFVMARDLNQGTINFSKCSYISKSQAESLRVGLSQPGDILLSHKGTVGEVAVVPEDFEYVALTPQVTFYRLHPNGRLDKGFLFQCFLGKKFQARLKSLAAQSTRSYIGITAQKQISITLPPLSEQKKIAQILSTWDKAITTTEQLLANSQQQKKALMQQLLTGKKRLLDENGVRFGGRWERVSLGELLDRASNGVTYDSKSQSGLPVTRIETISTGEINFDKVGFAPDTDKTRKHRLMKGDILYSHINSLEHIGRVAYYDSEIPLYHGMNLMLLRANKSSSSLFIFHLLNSFIGKHLAKRFAKSAVNQASISTTDLKSFNINIPAVGEQKKIASVLSKSDSEIHQLKEQLTHLRNEKKALMQQLLTGKRRVKVDEEAA